MELGIILTTFLSCWLSIQLCPWLWSTWHWICTLKTKHKKPPPTPTGQWSLMTVFHFLAGIGYSSDLEITQMSLDTTGLPGFSLGLKLAAPHSSVLWCYSKNPLLCPASHLSSAHLHQLFPQTIPCAVLPLIKLSLCSVAFSQMVPLNLLDLFHATPQLEGYSTFSHINHSSPLQNLTPVLISPNLKGWEFFFFFKLEVWNLQYRGARSLHSLGKLSYLPVAFSGPDTGYFSHTTRSLLIKSPQAGSKNWISCHQATIELDPK